MISSDSLLLKVTTAGGTELRDTRQRIIGDYSCPETF
jgi:hypothetical protein